MVRRLAALCAAAAVVASLATALVAVSFVPPTARSDFVAAESAALVAVLVLVVVAVTFVGRAVVLRPFHDLAVALQAERLSDSALTAFAHSPIADVAAVATAVRRTGRRLQSSMEQVHRERLQIAIIFEHMADGVLVLDAGERVELSNPAAARLLGQRSVAGRPLTEAVRDAEIVELARAAQASETVTQVVDLRQRPRRWVQVVATRLPDGQRTLLLLQDVTELRRTEAARRDFVANVSHELRTPVASLKALVETLEAGALDDPTDGPDFLRRMHVEVDGLAHLVTELLELARVEAGRLELELAPTLAHDLLRHAVERMRPYAERVGLQVVLLDPLKPGPYVQADGRRLGQVLANLLANAVKFTPPGGRIEAGARAAGDLVEFWVADTGVGIAPDHLLRVFERFYKTDPSRAGGGTGLGLAICKHLVRAHGGSIWAESTGERQGAAFRFTLPRVAAPGSGADVLGTDGDDDDDLDAAGELLAAPRGGAA